VASLWWQVEPILREKGEEWLQTFSMEEVFQVLITGVADLWIGGHNQVIEGVAICAWETHAHAKFYHVLFCGGKNLNKYLDAGLPKIEKYVCMMDGKDVIIEGRKGWQRMLASRGYSARSVKLRKHVKTLWSN
jgi:hypothetical protein